MTAWDLSYFWKCEGIMKYANMEAKVLSEINLFPKNKLLQLYDFIHCFRFDLVPERDRSQEIMEFAGCWQEMKQEKL